MNDEKEMNGHILWDGVCRYWAAAARKDDRQAWAEATSFLDGASFMAFHLGKMDLAEDLDLLAGIALWRWVYFLT